MLMLVKLKGGVKGQTPASPLLPVGVGVPSMDSTAAANPNPVSSQRDTIEFGFIILRWGDCSVPAAASINQRHPIKN